MSTKRILSLVLALVMVLGTFGTVFAEEPTSNPKVDWLVEQGYVLGDAGGLRLEDGITRAEVSVIVAKALGLEAEAAAMANIPSRFSDMNAGYAWANGFVNVLNANGYISGYPNGTFGPAKDITYAEVASMLVRVMGGLTEAEAKTAVWPTTYLAKAASLGIFDGVAGVDYSAKAVRGKIFEMVYNTLDKEVGNNTVVKAIVLENNRVESIGKNEVVVEVIRVEQIANYAKESRVEKGDQKSFVIDAKLGDVENLLGQVANFTINKDGKVIKITVDETYKIVEGSITTTKNKVTVNAGTAYTVELDERYKSTDERIFRTYHNDKAYAYEDFYKDVKEADYARLTIKNGKVLLINAFTFEDIAPVQEVKKDGVEVYVYNDQRDARIEKYAPVADLIGYTEGKLSRITRADIGVNDVVHVYTVGRSTKMIVRQDALVNGTYAKVSEGTRGNFFVHIDDAKYYMNDADYRRPVYSFNSKEFMTLKANRATSDLNGFRNEKVSALLDVNGDLQYIGAGIEFNEGIAIISDILSRGDVKYVKPNNETFTLTETFDSSLVIGGTTKNQKMSDFNRGDLVFVVNDEDNIDTMNRLEEYIDIEENANLVKKHAVNKFDMNSDYIRMNDNDDTRYQLLSKTNVFRVEYNYNTDGSVKSVKSITGTTVADVRSGAKKDTDLRAYVLTDKDFDAIDVGNRSRTSGRADVAHTVIFVDYTGATAAYNYETIRVTRLHTASSTARWIEGVTASGDTLTLDIDRFTELTYYVDATGNRVKSTDAGAIKVTIDVDDIVELGITKDDDKVVMTVDELIAYNAGTFKVVAMDSRTDYRWIILGDATYVDGSYDTRKSFADQTPAVKATVRELWVSNSVEEFGTPAINNVVTFDTNSAGDIYVIRSYSRNTPVTGLFEGSVLPEDKVTLTNVYKLAGQLWIRINGTDYKYVGLLNEDGLKALIGKEVAFNTIKVNNEVVVDDVVEVVGTTPPPATGVVTYIIATKADYVAPFKNLKLTDIEGEKHNFVLSEYELSLDGMRVSVEEMNLWLIDASNSEVNVEVKVEGDKLNVKSAAGKTFVEDLRTGALNVLDGVTLAIIDPGTDNPTINLEAITEFDSWTAGGDSVVVSTDGKTATITRAHAPTDVQLIGHAKVNGTKMQKSYKITIPVIGTDVTVAADVAFIKPLQDY